MSAPSLSEPPGRPFFEEEWARAYEATPPRLRALCKQAVAAQHALFGEAPDREEHFFAREAQGLEVRLRIRPAAWALTVFAADYASAPRLLAALMPAILARVPHTPVFCIGGRPRPELLCALELAGREQCRLISPAQAAELPAALPAGPGRIVLLHGGDPDPPGSPDPFAALRAAAAAAGIPCWEERRPPLLHLADTGVDAELVRLAHPDARIEASPSHALHPVDDPAPDAVYCSARAAREFSGLCPLVLAAGMEGCWVHPGLAPDFFRIRAPALAPSSGATGEADAESPA